MKKLNQKINVSNMISANGNTIPNQFIIHTENGCFFQSYQSVIAFRDNDNNIYLDKNKWDYSRTTGKYRNQFLCETKKETEGKIKSGEYKLIDLN
jgi:hypothetical protein